MSIYPLKVNKANMRTLHPMRVVASEEYISSHYDLYLTTEYYSNGNGGQNRYYRLNAMHPHSVDMALAYNIECPKCDRHTLKQVGRCLDPHTLGLYECPVCDRKEGKR